MSVPPIPTPLDQPGSSPFHPQRPFCFYPSIVNAGENHWLFRSATWNEIQVVNSKTSEELWIPRRFVGGVSNVDDPVMVIGLVKELELKDGSVYPHVRRVIEMPRRSHDKASTQGARPAAVVGIRVESGGGARIILGTVATGLLACVALLTFFRDGSILGSRAGVSRTAILERELPFTAQDDYGSIVSKLGDPAEDRWRMAGGVRYRRLWYPRQSLAVILVDDHYAGSRDALGRVVHAVQPLKNFR